MKRLNIIKVGLTVEHDGEVVTIFPDGELPPDCIVVVMEKESWGILKNELGVHLQAQGDMNNGITTA